MNRRELIVLGATSALFPTLSEAIILPPTSARYLFYLGSGRWQISDLLYVRLPPEAGTARGYTTSSVGVAFGANFAYTGTWGYGAWQMMTGAPTFQWFEFVDRRSGLYVKIWRGDKLEAKFSDGSRVKVRFNGVDAVNAFTPIRGTERLPDGSPLYVRTGENADGCRRTRSCRDDGGGSGAPFRPSGGMMLWSWSTQATPW